MRLKQLTFVLAALAVVLVAAGCGSSGTDPAGLTQPTVPATTTQAAPKPKHTQTTSTTATTTTAAGSGGSQAPSSGGGGTSSGGSSGSGGSGSSGGSTGGSSAPPSPSVNSPQGRHQLQSNPDCQNAPPPPPGYTGPVQC